MLIIKNTVKNQLGEVLSESEVIKKEYGTIYCPVPEDETVVLHKTIVINDDESETVSIKKSIFNNALGICEDPYVEGGNEYE